MSIRMQTQVRQAISKRPELTSNEEYAMIEFIDSIAVRNAMQMTLGTAKIFELHQSIDKKRKHQATRKSVLSKIPRENNYNSSSCPSGSETEDGKARHKKSIQGYPLYHICTSYPSQGTTHISYGCMYTYICFKYKKMFL